MDLTHRQLYAYLALGIVVLALGVRYVVLPRAGAEPSGSQLALAPLSAAPSPEPSVAPDVTVYVCGAVRRPGVVRLPAGARVCDAIDLAGGADGRAELAAVNLAAKVIDGQQIVVPERGAAPPLAVDSTTTGAAAGALVNINLAGVAELETLPGVGPATAQAIITYRTEQGPFGSIEDIKNVPGIGDAKFAAMKDAITV
jgi:competence protein ComEA